MHISNMQITRNQITAVQVKYKGENCKGDVVTNSTLYYPRSSFGTCIYIDQSESVLIGCDQSQPVAQVWHSRRCRGTPWANITYNRCTPPYEGQSEQLTLLINPCKTP